MAAATFGHRILVSGLTLTLGLLAAMPGFAQEPPAAGSPAAVQPAAPPPGSSHVRGYGPKAPGLLEQGRLSSPTFAALLAALEESDLLVCVETGILRAPGHLVFVGAQKGRRMVRITINIPDSDVRLLAALAHELQHAVEVASAPEVTSADAMLRLYQRLGYQRSTGGYCTRDAQRVEATVLRETLAAPMAFKR